MCARFAACEVVGPTLPTGIYVSQAERGHEYVRGGELRDRAGREQRAYKDLRQHGEERRERHDRSHIYIYIFTFAPAAARLDVDVVKDGRHDGVLLFIVELVLRKADRLMKCHVTQPARKVGISRHLKRAVC